MHKHNRTGSTKDASGISLTVLFLYPKKGSDTKVMKLQNFEMSDGDFESLKWRPVNLNCIEEITAGTELLKIEPIGAEADDGSADGIIMYFADSWGKLRVLQLDCRTSFTMATADMEIKVIGTAPERPSRHKNK